MINLDINLLLTPTESLTEIIKSVYWPATQHCQTFATLTKLCSTNRPHKAEAIT